MTQDNQHAAPENEPGGYGTPTAEQEMGGETQQDAQGAGTNEPQPGSGQEQVPRDADLPSSAAEIDENNDDSKGSASTSSEPAEEAGIPDGSGNDLPQEQSPKDDGGEEFNAG